MSKWSELNKKRKLAIQSILAFKPELREVGEITLEEIRAWWDSYRVTENRQIGYPIWLISNKAFRGSSKGKYILPMPEEGEQAAEATVKPIKTSRKIKDLTEPKTETTITVGDESNEISDDEFEAICKTSGINI